MTIGIVPQEFDPAYIRPRGGDKGFTTVYECSKCGVIGDILYRATYEPCPRCGNCDYPKTLSAAWIWSARKVRIRVIWWRPSTWSGYRIERTGVWVRAA